MSTHTPEKLIQRFLQNWDIVPADYFLSAIFKKSSYAQCLSRPSDETIKEIVEAGPTFGFTITVTEPAEAKTGLKLTFLWDNLKETEETMASLGLIEKEPADVNSSASEKKSGSWTEKVVEICAKENELGIPQGID